MYATVEDLVKELAAWYDDTDTTQYTLPTSKLNRYLHYTQLTLEEIWNYRAWPFKMKSDAISVTAGVGPLPTDFAAFGPNGYLKAQASSDIWAEAALQDVSVLRTGNKGQNMHVFAVGDTGQGDGTLAVFTPSTTENGSFDVFYEQVAPTLVLSDQVPLPASMHHVLLKGGISKVQEAKGDRRTVYRSEYVAALAKQVAVMMPLASRMNQMPMTVGRRW